MRTKDMSSREVISMLKEQGFTQVRQDGGDAIFAKPGAQHHVKVPTGRKSIAIGTLKSIEKQAGIKFTS